MILNVVGQLGIFGANAPIYQAASYFIPAVDFSLDGEQWEIDKDPADVEFYPIKVSRWLKGDSVSQVEYTMPEGSQLVVDEYVTSDEQVAALLSGGIEDTYLIDVTIRTNTGRTRQRKVKLRVKEQ